MLKFTPILLAIFGVALVGVVALVKLANPSPAPVTAQNIYSNVMYTLLSRKSENSQQWYVDDILAQANGHAQTAVAQAYWDNHPIAANLPSFSPEFEAMVLPASTNGGEKWVEVNLTNQTLYAHEGDATIYTMRISSGKPWTPTPTGEYRIWIKLKSTRMRGGSKETGDFYDLPNVPYTMYFNGGYGLHGAYWHNNFGHPMSHGCVNLSPADAKTLYEWASPVVSNDVWGIRATDDNPGTRVVIHT